MIRLNLTDEHGSQCVVTFYECESMGEPDFPSFEDLAMRFPWDAIPNERGHLPTGQEVSPEDFVYKADMFGFTAEVM